jgi:hypothetical protein
VLSFFKKVASKAAEFLISVIIKEGAGNPPPLKAFGILGTNIYK